jgi:hypothetical protein
VLTPDAQQWNSDPRYLRHLIDRAGLAQEEAAQKIGISVRAMRYYLNPAAGRPAPYPVQFALECLAERFASLGRLELDRFETLLAWQKLTGWAQIERSLRARGEVRLVRAAIDHPALQPVVVRAQDWVACADSMPIEDNTSLLEYMVYSPKADNWILRCRFDDGRWRQYGDLYLSGITHWRLARGDEQDRRLNHKEAPVHSL